VTSGAWIVGDFWRDQIVAHDRQQIFLLLLGFLVSFGFIRTSARLTRSVSWWPGGVVTDSGVHLHHLVWGITLMIVAGTLAFALPDRGPGPEISAAAFGVGVGLTLDEFALWVYLSDVYWSDEGRKSIDAVVMATVFMLLVMLGSRPLDLDAGSGSSIIAGSLLTLAICAVCFLKEKVLLGLVGLFVPLLAIPGAVRIAKPGSPWAQRLYGERRPAKQAKAERRFGPGSRHARWTTALRDAIGGRSSEEIAESDVSLEAGRRAAAGAVRERAAAKVASTKPPPAPEQSAGTALGPPPGGEG